MTGASARACPSFVRGALLSVNEPARDAVAETSRDALDDLRGVTSSRYLEKLIREIRSSLRSRLERHVLHVRFLRDDDRRSAARHVGTRRRRVLTAPP
jgi:hypothetical protein